MSAKQDRTAARTAADIERKYNIGKTFAEVMGVSTDARGAAENAGRAVVNLDNLLTPEEIFKRLTNNGKSQGLYRDDKGDLYINANFIQAVEDLFTKNIKMTGSFVGTAEVYLEPNEAVKKTIKNHLLGTQYILPSKIPLYDFNNDGEISIADAAFANMCSLGVRSISEWSGAVKSTVTITINMSNVDKAVSITGTDMWGGKYNQYIGLTGSSFEPKKNRVYGSDGVNIGDKLGVSTTCGLVFVTDDYDPLYYWYGVYGYIPNREYVLQTISNNGLTADANNVGTLAISGGSGKYNYYNMT